MTIYCDNRQCEHNVDGQECYYEEAALIRYSDAMQTGVLYCLNAKDKDKDK